MDQVSNLINMDDINKFSFLGYLIGILIFYFAMGYILKWAWNKSVSEIFGWKKISMWQAVSLLILVNTLFNSASSLAKYENYFN